MRIVVVSDGRRGIENQALGLAEAMVREVPEVLLQDALPQLDRRVISHSTFLRALPPKVQMRHGTFDKLPECQIVIGCGRQAIAPLLWVKAHRPHVFTVYVQDPRMSPTHFDVVIAPEHDDVRGENVISILGSPNRVTPALLQDGAKDFATELGSLPTPRAAILIGGRSKRHRLDAKRQSAHLNAAKALQARGYSLMISTSRRTPKPYRRAWQDFARGSDSVWLYNGDGPNPYFAFLSAADLILVTEDSTNMLTEACATGTPVHRLPMVGEPGKFAKLYAALEARCRVTRFNGAAESEPYAPLDATSLAAQNIWAAYLKR